MEHSKRSAFLSAAGAALCGVTKSHAAWEIVPELSITAETDDNLRLLPDEAPDLGNSGATTARRPGHDVVHGDSRQPDFRAAGEVRVLLGHDDEIFETTDGFVHFRGAHRLQQSKLGFRADYDQARRAEMRRSPKRHPTIRTSTTRSIRTPVGCCSSTRTVNA